MKGNLETASLCGWKTVVYIPEGGKEKIPLLYILGGKNIKEELADLAVLWEKTESEKVFPFLLAGLERNIFLMCVSAFRPQRGEKTALWWDIPLVVLGLSICFWKRGSLPERPAVPVPCGIRVGASIWKKLLCRKSRGMYIFPWAGQREGSVPV